MKKSEKAPVIQMTISDRFTEDEGTKTGIQTMLRVTSLNHIRLSEIADTKANILISVNAIIISVILTVMVPRMQENMFLAVPSLVFLVTSVATIIIAIIATRPSINRGTFRFRDITEKRTNLLFFGNFHKMPLEEYQAAMKMMMLDSDYLYKSLIKDIYYLGVVLAKKYRLIRLAYNVFMFGLVISVLAFCISFALLAKPEPNQF